MTEIKAQLKIDGNADAIDLPVYQGSTGPDVVDVRALVSQGVFTYDPGFVSTASCESKITYIDGAAGVLLHRGYPIEQLAEKSNFLETCYLLLHGELPDKTQHDQFVNSIRYHTMVDEAIHQFFRDFLAPHTPWQCFAEWLAPCRRSTMTVWTTTILNTGSKPRIA